MRSNKLPSADHNTQHVNLICVQESQSRQEHTQVKKWNSKIQSQEQYVQKIINVHIEERASIHMSIKLWHETNVENFTCILN